MKGAVSCERYRHARQNNVGIPLAAMHVRRREPFVSKSKSLDRSNVERETKLDSFDVAGSLKNLRSRCDILFQRDLALYWRRAPVVLAPLHVTTEANCRSGPPAALQFCLEKPPHSFVRRWWGYANWLAIFDISALYV